MSNSETKLKQEIEKFTDFLIGHLKSAGTIETLPHIIIQNVVSKDPEKIEKVATNAIKAGFEVEDPEYFEDNLLRGDLYNAEERMNETEAEKIILTGPYYSVEIITQFSSLDRDEIIENSLQVARIANECQCLYCGWGSFIEDDPLEFVDDYDEEEELPTVTM